MTTKTSNHSFTYLIESSNFWVPWISEFIYEVKASDILLNDLILSDISRNKLLQLVNEHNNSERLSFFNWLKPIHKILFEWDSWCWKTTSALAIAHELSRWIIIVNLSEIISSRLGETSKNLNKVIKYAEENNYIIFFDEFDSISKSRNDERELGEMRRLVNALIQLLDFSSDKLLIIAATNNISSIDSAIARRFEETVSFSKPWLNEIEKYLLMLEFYFEWKVKIKTTSTLIKSFDWLDFFRIKSLINSAIKRKAIQTPTTKLEIGVQDIQQ